VGWQVIRLAAMEPALSRIGSVPHAIGRVVSAGDEEIARRLRRDEPGAFDAFFDRYAKPLLGYLTRMLHDREAAEDVLQETMVRVCRAVGDYEERGTFPTRVGARRWTECSPPSETSSSSGGCGLCRTASGPSCCFASGIKWGFVTSPRRFASRRAP
jgi:hypothetical protein